MFAPTNSIYLAVIRSFWGKQSDVYIQDLMEINSQAHNHVKLDHGVNDMMPIIFVQKVDKSHKSWPYEWNITFSRTKMLCSVTQLILFYTNKHLIRTQLV